MNRISDYCYLIECAYYIINRYCCSFINLLTHDDGSIPYYLVQKVKIAIEYGKALLNTRYYPLYHHLLNLKTCDYIDLLQYEDFCSHWNTIKTQTQIVEMYFNQISLLIYPIISSTRLLSVVSAQNKNLSALEKINIIIHDLIAEDENSGTLTPFSKKLTYCFEYESVSTMDTKTPDYLSEEELYVFIVNSIIEPLFDEKDSTDVYYDYDENRNARTFFKCYDCAKSSDEVFAFDTRFHGGNYSKKKSNLMLQRYNNNYSSPVADESDKFTSEFVRIRENSDGDNFKSKIFPSRSNSCAEYYDSMRIKYDNDTSSSSNNFQIMRKINDDKAKRKYRKKEFSREYQFERQTKMVQRDTSGKFRKNICKKN